MRRSRSWRPGSPTSSSVPDAAGDVQLRASAPRDTQRFFVQAVTRLAGELDRDAVRDVGFERRTRTRLPDSLDYRRTSETLDQERLLQSSATRRRCATHGPHGAIYARTGQVPSEPAAQPGGAGILETLTASSTSARGLLRAQSQRDAARVAVTALEPMVADQLALADPQICRHVGVPRDPLLADFDGRLAFIASGEPPASRACSTISTARSGHTCDRDTAHGARAGTGRPAGAYDAAEGRLAQAGASASASRLWPRASGSRWWSRRRRRRCGSSPTGC